MQPTGYNPSENFTADAAALVSGRSTVKPDALDAEHAAIAVSINQIISSLGLIQRDDGHLIDQSVDVYNLTSAVLALIGSGGFTIASPVGWLTATVYPARQIVTQGSGTYVSATAHTSGVFATDLAAGKWALIFSSSAFIASSVAFTPTGTLISTTVQAAIAEAALEANQKSANLSDVADVATSRTNLSVPSKSEIQKATYNSCQAGGSFDVITGAFMPAIASLASPLLLLVESVGANTTTTPTFNADGTGAKTIVKGSNQALVAGDIPGANFMMILAYDVSLDKYVLLNPAYSVAVATAGGFMPLTAAVAANALTATLAAGTVLNFNDGTSFTLGSAITLTVPSGQPMGTVNATPSRIWIGAVKNGGTPELFARNNLSGVSIVPPNIGSTLSTTAIAAAPSAQVNYSATLRSTQAWCWVGYIESTQAIAGTWAAAPTSQGFGPGVLLPGQQVQRTISVVTGASTGVTAFPDDNTIPQSGEGDQYMAATITPTSAANLLVIDVEINGCNNATPITSAALFQDAIAGALKAVHIGHVGASMALGRFTHRMLAGSLSTTTFKARMGNASGATTTFNGTVGAGLFGGVVQSYIEPKEFMT